MRRVAEQERSPFSEMLRHPMMHVIGRKPVDHPDLHLEVVDRPVADVTKRQRIGAVGALVAYRPDQACFSFSGQREDAEEIGLVEIDVQFAIQRRAGGFDVGDVEDLPIGAAGKPGADRPAHDRARAVTTGDVGRRTVMLLTVGSAQASHDTIFLIRETDQLGSPLDHDIKRFQPLDQEPLMLVLGKYLQERVGRQAGADVSKRKTRRCFAFRP